MIKYFKSTLNMVEERLVNNEFIEISETKTDA